MITHSQARNMAEALWGKDGTTSERTNRKGAFYFSCSGHGGFVIDARALTEAEKEALSRHCKPTQAREIYDPETGRVHIFFNPFRKTSRTARMRISWRSREVPIFMFEEDCDWCLPVLFAGITAGTGMTREGALDCFKRWYEPSNHELITMAAPEGATRQKSPERTET